jgi:SWI/SNF-related matrix-associated actin-dependent regulator 1 of chromatin subfamily A
MMKVIEFKDGSEDFGLYFPYDEYLVERCRELKNRFGWQIFGWDSQHRTWRFKIEALETVINTFPSTECSMSSIMKLKEFKKQNAVTGLKQSEAGEEAEVEGVPLFPYQKRGVAFLMRAGRALLADEMGLGKSIQAISALKKLGLGDVLIVCPASLKSNWQKELAKWVQLDSTIIEREWAEGINIINYDRLSKMDKTKHWDLLIADESHALKNSKAIRTKALKEIAKNADRVYLLTGTPILNRPVELVSQLDILGKLKALGGEWWFKQTYCDGHQDKWGHWDFSGASNIDQLKQRMQPFMLRRTKEEVLKDLPEKTVTTLYLDQPEPKAYEAVRQELKRKLQDSKEGIKGFYRALGGMNDVQRAMYLDGLAQNPQYKQMLGTALASIETLKQEAVRQKLLLVGDILDSYKDNNVKCVVFGTHKETIRQLSEKYENSVYITGDVDPDKRQRAVDKFQEDPSTTFFFGTMRSSGTGLTLTAASNLVFLELDWTPAVHAQSESRIHRIGSQYPVTITYTILKGTIEEDIANALMDKSTVINSLLSGKILHKIIAKNLL